MGARPSLFSLDLCSQNSTLIVFAISWCLLNVEMGEKILRWLAFYEKDCPPVIPPVEGLLNKKAT
jgi:hypothetical protein